VTGVEADAETVLRRAGFVRPMIPTHTALRAANILWGESRVALGGQACPAGGAKEAGMADTDEQVVAGVNGRGVELPHVDAAVARLVPRSGALR